MGNVISPQEDAVEEIAVIGLAGRFPGAKDIDQFWQNLRDGVEAIIHFTDQELEAQGIPSEWLKDPDYVKAGTVLEDYDKFDALFFGYTPKEAENIDPQQRLFLETAWEALENAGYNPDTYDNPIGVFAGSNPNDYLDILPAHLDLKDSAGALEKLIGNEKDFLCTRVSYKFNLRGPSITLQTGCSTSLVAVQLACQSLLNYQCTLALAGGVTVNLRYNRGYFYQEGMIPSPDGHCRAFDADARGTVLSQGVGVVVLKRLSEALSDGDTIHAVIKGVAINNDGSLKAGYTAPSVDGQAEVIAMAHALSGVSADTISYIEAHGTGTSLGDPIEIAALTEVFRLSTNKRGFCAIGSVKTNIGHTDAAAGIAGLIKTILMLKHKEIPPSLHFEKPNPSIDFENSPFYVPTELSEWPDNEFPRRAGVSSFGVGGTNVHAVLEEAPAPEPSGRSRPWQLLLMSAQTDKALEKATANLVEHLKNNPQQTLPDVAYTLNAGRKGFNYRRMVVCKDGEDAVKYLETLDPGVMLNSYQEPMNRDVVFMFSGQGSQYVNMGLELYQAEPVFREHIDKCSEILRPHLSLDLRNIVYPEKGNIDEIAQQLKQTSIAQPALFTIEYALATLWMSWGVHPAAMVGHSIGEYVAACLAGVFSLEDALSLVATRGRLMQEMPAGSMLAVQVSEKAIQRFLEHSVSLAAVNAPSYCVVSGEKEAVEALKDDLEKNNLVFTHLHTSHAFHSKMMDPMLGEFTEQVGKFDMHPPQIPIVSTVTGTWIGPEEMATPKYWTKNARQTVRFSDCVHELLKEPGRILLEVGPGHALATLASQQLDASEKERILSSIRHPDKNESDVAFILKTLGRLWLAGVRPDWSGFYKGEQRQRIPLPTYPFERRRHWPEEQENVGMRVIAQKQTAEKLDMGQWFYVPSWKRTLPPMQLTPRESRDEKSCWLVFVDECKLGSKLVELLEGQGQEVITAQVGAEFGSVSENGYTINPRAKDHYDALIKELRRLGKLPKKIVHLWSVTADHFPTSAMELFNRFQDLGFYSLIFLTQALAKEHMTQAIELEVVTNHVHDVTDEEASLYPEKATVLGPCKVIPQEYANIICRNIDLGIGGSEEQRIEQLLGELTAEPTDSTVAYRGKHRWVQSFEAASLEKAADLKPKLRENGVYLITGGLGDIGLVFAQYLAQTVRAKLALLARTGLPPRGEWQDWLETHPEADPVSHKIRKINALEELGAEVLIISANVANEDQMREAVAQTEERFGGIDAVIHAAGIFVEASIQEVSRDICEQQFQSKVNGLFVLEKVLKDRAIDFCLLNSSLSSFLGGLGFAGYTAANLFMDAFAHRHNGKHSVPWISVNWDAWQFQDEIALHIRKGSDLAELSIKPEQGGEALLRILSFDLGPQIVVSTGDLQARLDKWIKLESLREPEQIQTVETSALYPRPVLSSEYIAPGNPTEESIAEIWQQLLKIEKVGMHDNFFELGGHSLLALQVITRLRNTFPVQFPVATLFERPTVGLLSEMILEQEKGAPSFEESSRRGQRRKERKLQRRMSSRPLP